jgi:hypothetical protein
MRATLSYNDTEGGISLEDMFTFKSAEDKSHFEFDYVDADKTKYSYSIKYFYTNGMSRTVDAQQADSEELVLPVS